MIFVELDAESNDGKYIESPTGLPKIRGASDMQDSSMLAAMMAIVKHPKQVDLLNYILTPDDLEFAIYCRCPFERRYSFSRDQYVCLIAGLNSQGYSDYVSQYFVDGYDLMSPSVKGHEARCKAQDSTNLQDAWLWIDVVYHAKIDPLSEPNQLICMMLKAPAQYLTWWVKNNPQWERSIDKYWWTEDGAWRREPELAGMIKSTIKQRIIQ